MAPQPLARVGGLEPAAAAPAADERSWRAYHLHYHEDQDRLLREMLAPLVARLRHEGRIGRFFFVRYNLGGPHVRLRWQPLGDPADAEGALAAAAADFFLRAPSTASLPEATVRKLNRTVLRIDPLAGPQDDVVVPDNSWQPAPVRFEVERYGGHGRLGATLDLFTASSERALVLLDELRALSEGRAQTHFVRLVLQLAAAFAGDDEELVAALAGYGMRFMGSAFAPCAEKADHFFAAHAEVLGALADEALAPAALDGEPLVAAVRRFLPALEGLGEKKRWHVAASHLHMTANRLGLLNPDEVYLSRLAELVVRRAAAAPAVAR
jgi:hypothetical protein